AEREAPPTPRHALFLRLHALLERLPHARAAALASLGTAPPADARSLTAAEVARLAACRLIEIGAHSVSHGRLTAMPPAERHVELAAGRAALEAAGATAVVRFAYPHGSHDRATAADVRAAGYVEAYGSRQDVVLASTDPFALPRVAVPDVDGGRFERFV